MITKTIPLALVNRCFTNAGLKPEQTYSVIATLVHIWRMNDHNEGMTRELIFNELELDELTAQTLWNTLQQPLLAISQQIRELALAGRLVSWKVLPLTIILEIEYENLVPLSTYTPVDRS